MTSDAPDDFPADLAAPSLVDFERLARSAFDVLPPEELAEIPTVCGNLREAMGALEADYEFLLQGDVFTRDQIEGYMDLKWEEIYAYEHTPHPVEFQMYYSCQGGTLSLAEGRGFGLALLVLGLLKPSRQIRTRLPNTTQAQEAQMRKSRTFDDLPSFRAHV